ncbi:MAG: glycosyltransferase family 4 protein [Polaribacter sp.]|nr:glycosyltransferase family 4 protein [Polaribacter sp.]
MNKKLHILFLCGWYPSRILPTNGDFIQRHAEAVFLKHSVTVIHIITDPFLKNKIEITEEKINGIPTHIAYVKATKNPISKIFLFIRAFTIVLKKTKNIDVVHLNEIFPFGILSLYLKWFKKIPFIISEHWTDYAYPFSKNIGFFHKTASKIIAKNASFVCPVSIDLQNSLLQFGLNANYTIVENVVNTAVFFPIENKNSIFTIVHISNMNDDQKNISGILNVVAKLHDQKIPIRVQMIGENASKYNSIKEIIGLESIEFIDHLPHHLLVKHLQKSNILVLFSNYENLPCVILESFACGIPVISTNVGGIKEYFPSNFGVLIDAKNEEKLLEEIKLFHQNKKEIASKKEMYSFINTNFSNPIICKKFSSLYYKSLKF